MNFSFQGRQSGRHLWRLCVASHFRLLPPTILVVHRCIFGSDQMPVRSPPGSEYPTAPPVQLPPVCTPSQLPSVLPVQRQYYQYNFSTPSTTSVLQVQFQYYQYN